MRLVEVDGDQTLPSVSETVCFAVASTVVTQLLTRFSCEKKSTPQMPDRLMVCLTSGKVLGCICWEYLAAFDVYPVFPRADIQVREHLLLM